MNCQETEENKTKGFDYLLKAAEAGDRQSMILVARAFDTGQNLSPERYCGCHSGGASGNLGSGGGVSRQTLGSGLQPPDSQYQSSSHGSSFALAHDVKWECTASTKSSWEVGIEETLCMGFKICLSQNELIF